MAPLNDWDPCGIRVSNLSFRFQPLSVLVPTCCVHKATESLEDVSQGPGPSETCHLYTIIGSKSVFVLFYTVLLMLSFQEYRKYYWYLNFSWTMHRPCYLSTPHFKIGILPPISRPETRSEKQAEKHSAGMRLLVAAPMNIQECGVTAQFFIVARYTINSNANAWLIFCGENWFNFIARGTPVLLIIRYRYPRCISC